MTDNGNKRLKQALLATKWDLGEQTMPQQHLRPYGYPSQMACNSKDNKLEPHAMNLILSDRKTCKKIQQHKAIGHFTPQFRLVRDFSLYKQISIRVSVI